METSELFRSAILGHANFPPLQYGCSFFAYNWKLPAYSGAFLLTVDNFSFFYLLFELFGLQFQLPYLQLEFFCLQWESASNKGLKGL